MTYVRKNAADKTRNPSADTSGAAQEGSLSNIHRYPMLDHAEEQELVERWQSSSDERALEKLITSHLRMVAKQANGFKRYGLPIEDLMSEGTIGLIKAIDRFDADRGFRLATYAKWWIRASMQEYIMRSWSLVRIGTTLGQKKLFFNLRKMKIELCGSYEAALEPEQREAIIEQLDVSETDFDIMDARMSGQDCSLNEMVSDGEATEWQDWLVDERDNQETLLASREQSEYDRQLIASALEDVSERDRQIFLARRIDENKPTLGELSKKFDISPERVRQIEHNVFAKLCKTLGADQLEVSA